MAVVRIVVRKKEEFAEQSPIRQSIVYDVEGVDRETLLNISEGILFTKVTDDYFVFEKDVDFEAHVKPNYLFYSLKRGQFDQRADAAEQCLKLKLEGIEPTIRSYILAEADNADDLKAVLINPVDTERCGLSIPEGLSLDEEGDEEMGDMSSALSPEDLALIDAYFEKQGRQPTETEMKVLDTYWSDHCRHTTFNTELSVFFEEDSSNEVVKKEYDKVLAMRAELGRGDKTMSLMELATLDARYLRSKGELQDMDISEEINACSIKRPIRDARGNSRDYLVMFKNETHNHPTEIEPFGGAATCIGGAIRDPLSGRSFVYNSMRLSGAGNPYMKTSDLLPGKLMQQDICQLAAAGFSSYGNQVGLATGLVDEVYHAGYTAKRFEAGAVIGAAPVENVVRERPEAGDIVLMIGGRTGRDGVGGASGSSNVHTDKSIEKSGAEVQKGNAPEERKLQRLFRKKAFAQCIRRCNDFGAGGVSVAVGELADSLEIYLDRAPLKYKGLSPTEIAVSESQERMAIVINPRDLEKIQAMCDEENVESTVIAEVKDDGRVRMLYKEKVVFDIERSFIDSAGARRSADIRVGAISAPPVKMSDAVRFDGATAAVGGVETADEEVLEFFNESSCAKKGLVELFDNSVGSGTVLYPFAGARMMSPAPAAVAKVPVEGEDSVTASVMAYGFNPDMSVSPFYMGRSSVLESAAKVVAAGANIDTVYLSMQEFFPKLKDNWNEPFEALLGAGSAMRGLGLAAIGGKDSMSGTYQDIDVPATLVSFAFTTEAVSNILGSAFVGGNIYLVGDHARGSEVDFKKVKADYQKVYQLNVEGKITAALSVSEGGVAATVAKMAFGNGAGAELTVDSPFDYRYGALVVESKHELPFEKIGVSKVGAETLTVNGKEFALSDLEKQYLGILNTIYPYEKPEYTELPKGKDLVDNDLVNGKTIFSESESALSKTKEDFVSERISRREALAKIGKNVRVFLPSFPGTNSEYDMKREFERYGCTVDDFVFVNKTEEEMTASIAKMEEKIQAADIVAISGGFTAGDEPDGSAKFIASVFRNDKIMNAVHKFLDRDGLMLGICNGFQALVRLGLIPHGRITEQAAVMDYNIKRKHIAKVSPVRIECTDSPWLSLHNVGDVVMTVFSHGEGRFRFAGSHVQAATTYTERGMNGSDQDIEGAIALDGRIFGKMGHIERASIGTYKNVPYTFDTKIIQSGVAYCAKKNQNRNK